MLCSGACPFPQEMGPGCQNNSCSSLDGPFAFQTASSHPALKAREQPQPQPGTPAFGRDGRAASQGPEQDRWAVLPHCTEQSTPQTVDSLNILFAPLFLNAFYKKKDFPCSPWQGEATTTGQVAEQVCTRWRFHPFFFQITSVLWVPTQKYKLKSLLNSFRNFRLKN